MNQKIADFFNIFLGLRKTLVMLLLMAIAVIFRVKGYLSGDNVVDMLKATTISFFGANSVEHFTAMVKEHLASKNAGSEIAAPASSSATIEEDKAAPGQDAS